MDVVTAFGVSLFVLNYFISPYSMIAALIGTWLLVRWMVRVKAEERDSSNQMKASLFIPKSIWSYLTLALALFHIMDAFFSQNWFSQFIQTVTERFSNLSVVQAITAELTGSNFFSVVFSHAAPLLSVLLKPILEQPDYFFMLLMLLILELIIHPELRAVLMEMLFAKRRN